MKLCRLMLRPALCWPIEDCGLQDAVVHSFPNPADYQTANMTPWQTTLNRRPWANGFAMSSQP